jgi:hypothetical protein
MITSPHLAVSDFGTPRVPGGRPAGGFCTHQSSRVRPSQPFLGSPGPVLVPSIGPWYPLAIDFGLLQADSEFGTPTANSPAEPTRPHGTPRHLGPRAIDSDFDTPSGHGGILRFRLATREPSHPPISCPLSRSQRPYEVHPQTRTLVPPCRTRPARNHSGPHARRE